MHKGSESNAPDETPDDSEQKQNGEYVILLDY
jgi:hypothetical protein